MGWERNIERERESDRVWEKERDWERDMEMEREGKRERVREREREKDRERDSSYHMGAPPPASSAPPRFHGLLKGHQYPDPNGSGASLLSHSAPFTQSRHGTFTTTVEAGSIKYANVCFPVLLLICFIFQVYPRSPGGSYMSFATPGAASPVSGGTTGPDQPPPPLRSPTVHTN
jgi:hypothetical protein